MMDKKLVLENNEGNVVRTFQLEGEESVAVFRYDSRRLEVWKDESHAIDEGIKYDVLGKVSQETKTTPLKLGEFGQLRLVDFVEKTEADPVLEKSSSKLWWTTLSLFMICMLGTVVAIRILAPETTAAIEEEKKVEVVQIIKKVQVQKKQQPVPMTNVMQTQKPIEPPKTQDLSRNVKRLGALGVLGSLSNSKQKGGLNLGAVNTTAGAGLGGSGGSGGVQTSLYAKGIVSAPLGPGGNIQGAGGYGTKGKGGGQAGYGSLSLVGSAGTSTIPLGQEALVEGGLDKDLIAQVVQRNMGQIRFCYEQGLQLEPALAGRVMASWTINGQGVVVDPGIANSTLSSKTVEDCILLRLRTWKFPLPQGGANVKVAYPFMLKRTGT
jgi:hypothetical protein